MKCYLGYLIGYRRKNRLKNCFLKIDHLKLFLIRGGKQRPPPHSMKQLAANVRLLPRALFDTKYRRGFELITAFTRLWGKY